MGAFCIKCRFFEECERECEQRCDEGTLCWWICDSAERTIDCEDAQSVTIAGWRPFGVHSGVLTSASAAMCCGWCCVIGCGKECHVKVGDYVRYVGVCVAACVAV